MGLVHLFKGTNLMGLMNFLSGGRARGGSFDRALGGSQLAPTHGNHAIDPGRVLAPTAPNAITPTNPGNFSSIRTAPIVPNPRYFNQQEATAIRQLSSQRRHDLSSTKSAYKGLSQLEKTDAAVHREHRQYETAVAKGELKKKQADTRHAKALHGMRPAYAKLSGSLENASDRAAMQIQANQQQQMLRQQQFKARLAGVR
jgi:hypothetical protein